MTSGTARDWDPAEITDALPGAIAGEEMHLYFQPVVSLADRTATKLEALLRWAHPERGMLGPGVFMEALQAGGLQSELEEWTIREALHQLAYWSDGIPGQLSISVNLAGPHAFEGGLAEVIRATADGAGASMQRLGIEISEAVAGGADRDGRQALREISDLGVDITVDDFSGRIELDELRRLPISALKIGRTIVAGIPDDPTMLEIASMAISRGRELGLGVIATGIENPGQAASLREIGCRYGQGFLYSVPMPAEVLEERILRG
ncbi:MAG TPA: EAL domain-containing protein [Solirubrobacterales bacterium]|nr:EAL domain-containing protein [Solirubrobacterales bacterium]